MDDLSQFMRNDTWFMQTVKIKMVELCIASLINPADSEARAGNFVGTTYASCQSTHKRRFTATQITD